MLFEFITIFCRTTSTHLLSLSVSCFILIPFFSLHYNIVVDGETQQLYTKLPNNAGYNALTQLPQDFLLQNVGNPIYPKDLMEQRAFDAIEIIYNYTTSSSLHENSSMGWKNDDGANDRSTATRGQHQIKEALSYLQANDYRATLTLMGYKGGELSKQINQDRAVIISPYTWWSSTDDEEPPQGDQTMQNKLKGSSTIKDKHEHDFFLGVFDGHGPYGEFVSEYAATTLPKLLANRLYEHHHSNKTTSRDTSTSSSSSITTEDEVQLLLTEDIMKQVISDIITFTFIDIDSTIPDTSHARRGGCTASVVLRYGATLFIANAGDSISFVATTTTTAPSNGLSYKSKIHYQTREDKPHLPDERTRIESFGGRVSLPSRKGGTSRVHYGNYGLAMSRSLGDWEAGVLGVIPDPIIHTINIPQLLRKEEEEQAVITESNPVKGDNTDEDHQCVSSSSTTENTCEATNANHGSVTMFVVSGTDGLFDYVEPEIVAEEIASTFRNYSISASDEFPSSSMFSLIKTCGNLVLTSAHGWNEESRGAYRDDIAIAVHKILI